MAAVDLEEFTLLSLMMHDRYLVDHVDLHYCLLLHALPRYVPSHLPVEFVLKIVDLQLTYLARLTHMRIKVGRKVVYMSTHRISGFIDAEHADDGNITSVFLQGIVVAVDLHELYGRGLVVEVGRDGGAAAVLHGGKVFPLEELSVGEVLGYTTSLLFEVHLKLINIYRQNSNN